jgi:hypothetical protein
MIRMTCCNTEYATVEETLDHICKQRVWRAFSQSETCGFFVWEILEYVDNGNPLNVQQRHMFEKCRDGSFILIQCYHFWTEDSAMAAYANNYLDSKWHTVTYI